MVCGFGRTAMRRERLHGKGSRVLHIVLKCYVEEISLVFQGPTRTPDSWHATLGGRPFA